MTEDRFEQIIRDAARDYNRPPEITPREEMWARIQDAQRAAAAIPVLYVERGGASSHRSIMQRTPWWGLAAAAGILLVAGIGIGRFTGDKESPIVASTRTAEVAPVVANATPDDTVTGAGDQVSDPSSEDEILARTSGNSTRVASAPTRSSSTGRTPLDVEANRMNATYQLASLRHLADMEAFLTSFQTDSANRAMDPIVAKWSRDLLSNTRLLLDSPAARDPLRKHLFEDLELVLTQIVQLSSTPNPSEREMVESTIKDGHVMTRLRTAIPAGKPQGS